MSDEIRVGRPQQPQRYDMPSAGVESKVEAEPSSKMPWIVLVVVVVVLIVLGVLFRNNLFGGKNSGSNGVPAMTDVSQYQAVFLTNGQVYFGKISHANSQYVNLTDIYYLQVVRTAAAGQRPVRYHQPAGPAANFPG